MEAYNRWVRTNKDYVHSLESLANGTAWFLQGLTMLLPERFPDSEIGTEAATSISGLITAINAHIIDTTPGHNAGPPHPDSFPYCLCISVLKNLETLLEVVAQHFYGDDKKWNFIAIIEATKVLVRLAMFHNSGYKMLLHGGETPNVEQPSDDLNSQHLVIPGAHHRQNSQNLEERASSALSRSGENAMTASKPVWLQRIQHQQSIMELPTPVVEKPTLSTILSEKGGVKWAFFLMGETLFITRPLIYVLFIRKYGIRSWIPWFLSLAVDFTGISFLSLVTKSRHGGKEEKFLLSRSEKDELKSRKLLWALYLMRDPFFSKYFRQRLESTGRRLEPVPVIGFVTDKIVNLVIGVQSMYTYLSGS